MPKFPFFQQFDVNDCGPTCLRMISHFYGKSFSLDGLRQKCFISRDGVSLLGISEAAEDIGFRTEGLKLNIDQLIHDVQKPCIIHWKQNHFVVLYKVKKNKFFVADPAFGLIEYDKSEFVKHWASTLEDRVALGICLQLTPAPDFYAQKGEKINKGNFGFLFTYLKGYRRFALQVVFGIVIATSLQLIFPFLFQAIVDKGVIIPNPSLIVAILLAQLVLVFSRFLIGFFRNWIILHLGARINIFLISDFLLKLMRLPLGYFDSKTTGDILQRVIDHKRVERFLTETTVSLFYSILTILIMGCVLAIFSLKIFLVFIIGSVFYLLWTIQFMKKRRDLDNKKFAQLSNNQNSLLQLINGMHEIKLNSCEKQKRWEWEAIQAALFRINVKGLTLEQKQMAGALFFNEFKDVLIIFFAANLVLQGSLTIGALVAISYVIGQLSGPVDQMIEFFHSTQDAKISLERLSEIHNQEDEEPTSLDYLYELPENADIKLNQLSFQYEGPHSPFVLKDITMLIPVNKQTAIVGTSGSGKTTLLKLILGFYQAQKGDILIGGINLRNISPKYWRNNCGVVMQNGFIFSDTIARNISLSDEVIDKQKLYYACKLANIEDILDNLPLGLNTKIGDEGIGISQGQKQRILIARAIYKNPDYIFFDEATNSLDANNERYIMDNLDTFFKNKTVVVVAHRLSTVKNADQIIMLEKGRIIESGNHEELVRAKGSYYKLVKNQLELGD